MEQLVIDVGFDAEELPNLSVLESNFQDVAVLLISESSYLGIEDLDGWYSEWPNEVNTVLNLLSAFSAKHHGAKSSPSLYRTYVRYGKRRIRMARKRKRREVLLVREVT
jgi:hypothetical protein